MSWQIKLLILLGNELSREKHNPNYARIHFNGSNVYATNGHWCVKFESEFHVEGIMELDCAPEWKLKKAMIEAGKIQDSLLPCSNDDFFKKLPEFFHGRTLDPVIKISFATKYIELISKIAKIIGPSVDFKFHGDDSFALVSFKKTEKQAPVVKVALMPQRKSDYE